MDLGEEIHGEEIHEEEDKPQKCGGTDSYTRMLGQLFDKVDEYFNDDSTAEDNERVNVLGYVDVGDNGRTEICKQVAALLRSSILTHLQSLCKDQNMLIFQQMHPMMHTSSAIVLTLVTIVDCVFNMVDKTLSIKLFDPKELTAMFEASQGQQQPFAQGRAPEIVMFVLARYDMAREAKAKSLPEEAVSSSSYPSSSYPTKKLAAIFWANMCIWFTQNAGITSKDVNDINKERVNTVIHSIHQLFADFRDGMEEEDAMPLAQVLKLMCSVSALYKTQDAHHDVDGQKLNFNASMVLITFVYFLLGFLVMVKGSIANLANLAKAANSVRKSDEDTSYPSSTILPFNEPIYLDVFHRAYAILGGTLLASIKALASVNMNETHHNLPPPSGHSDPGNHSVHVVEAFINDTFRFARAIKIRKTTTSLIPDIFFDVSLAKSFIGDVAASGMGPIHSNYMKRCKALMKSIIEKVYDHHSCAFAKYTASYISHTIAPSKDNDNHTKRLFAHAHCLARLVESIPPIVFLLTLPLEKTQTGNDASLMSLMSLKKEVFNVICVEIKAANDMTAMTKEMQLIGKQLSKLPSYVPNPTVNMGRASKFFRNKFATCISSLDDNDTALKDLMDTYLGNLEKSVNGDLFTDLKNQTLDLYNKVIQAPPKVIGYVKIGHRGQWSRRFDLRVSNSETSNIGLYKTFKMAYSTSSTPIHKWFRYEHNGQNYNLDLLVDNEGEKSEKRNILAGHGQSTDQLVVRDPIDNISKKDFVFGPFRAVFANPGLKAADMASNCPEVVEILQKRESVMVFGFGVSGAGKTSTLVKFTKSATESEPGLMEKWFDAFRTQNKADIVDIKIFVCEVYLNRKDPKKPMLINNTVKNINKDSETSVVMDEVIKFIDEQRVISPTSNNPISSRSHVIISVMFSMKDGTGTGTATKTKPVFMHIADLAGSENEFNPEDKTQYDRFASLLQTSEDKVVKLFDRDYSKFGSEVVNPLALFEVSSMPVDDSTMWKIKWSDFISLSHGSASLKIVSLNAIVAEKGNVEKGQVISQIHIDNSDLQNQKYINTLLPQQQLDDKLLKNVTCEIIKQRTTRVSLVSDFAAIAKFMHEKTNRDQQIDTLQDISSSHSDDDVKNEANRLIDHMKKRVAFIAKALTFTDDHSNIITKAMQILTKITIDDLVRMEQFFNAATDAEEYMMYYLLWHVVYLTNRFAENATDEHKKHKDVFRHYAMMYTLLGMTNNYREYYGPKGVFYTIRADALGPGCNFHKTHGPGQEGVDKINMSLKVLFTGLLQRFPAIGNDMFQGSIAGCTLSRVFNSHTHCPPDTDTFTLVFLTCQIMCQSEENFRKIVKHYMKNCTEEGKVINYELECIKEDLVNSVKIKLNHENPMAKPYFHPDCAAAMTHPVMGDKFEVNDDDKNATCKSIIFNVAYNLSFMSAEELAKATGEPQPLGQNTDWYNDFINKMYAGMTDRWQNFQFGKNNEQEPMYINPIIMCVMNLDASIKDPPTPFLDVNGIRNSLNMIEAINSRESPASYLDNDILCALNVGPASVDDTSIRTLKKRDIMSHLIKNLKDDVKDIYDIANQYRTTETQSLMQDINILNEYASATPIHPQYIRDKTDIIEKFAAKSIIGNTLYVDMMCKYGSPAACYIVPNSEACPVGAPSAWDRVITNDLRTNIAGNEGGFEDDDD